MAKPCGKCGGSGLYGPRFEVFGKSYPCKYCQGTGVDNRWGDTRCEGCGTNIEYRYDWLNIPKYCQDCKIPRHTNCKGCGRSIEYKVYWDNIPEYCKDCKEWKSKSCNGCGTQIKYKSFWDNVPEYCTNCREWKHKQCKGCGADVKFKSYWNNIPEICQECKKMARRRGADEICAGTEMERWLSGKTGEKIRVFDDHFHVTLYVDGGHVSGNVHKYSTRTWEVHGRIRSYNSDGSQSKREDDLYFDF